MANILIVDDDAEIVKLLTDLLTDEGYTVRSVANGRAALIAVHTERPDLVLLDLYLPVAHGATVARELRAFDATLPIMVMSAVAEDGIALLAAGQADGFIEKPFDLDEFLACVADLVPLTRQR